MNEEYSNYYDPEKKRSPILRIVIIFLIIFAVILVILLFTKAFSKGPDLYPKLTDMANNYIDKDKYPKSIGECSTYTLKKMITNQSADIKKEFAKCDDTKTYVKVCNLGDNNYQFTPVLSCKKQKTEFTDWKTGEIDDLLVNNSDVKIYFDGEVLENGDRTYYPNNETNLSKVSEYYTSTPGDGYIYKVNPQTAYKWYTEAEEKEYYNNGEYAAEANELYTMKEDSKTKTYLTLSRPADASYRTINSVTMYAVEYASYPYKYECRDGRYRETIISTTLCEKRNTGTFSTTVKMHYTCDGVNEAEKGALCKARGNWTTNSCANDNQTVSGQTSDGYDYTKNLWTGYTCVKADGYSVKDVVYKWYRMVDAKRYYPSNSTNVEEEKTYYISTPIAGASKDETTETTAYQYFKLVPNETSEPNWVSIGDAEMSKDELINSFKELGYKVSSLKSIDKNENIRYRVVIKYRNRK